MHSRLIAAAALLSVTLIAACSGSPSDATVPEPSPRPDQVEPISEDTPEVATAEDEPSPRPDQVELIEGPFSEDGIQVILGTPDVAVGTHRMAFVLNAKESPVRAPFATVVSKHVPEDGSGSNEETALAVFRPWPYGTRGSYTTSLTFDVAGTWQIDVTVLGEGGDSRTAQISFPVAEETEAPDVGAPAIPSENKTLADVDDLAKLTTGSNPRPRSLRDHDRRRRRLRHTDSGRGRQPRLLHQRGLRPPGGGAPAAQGQSTRGRPTSSTSTFTTTRTRSRGILDRARISPIVFEWRLLGVEWSFVIDRDGKIAARFESFATFDELDEALRRIL